MPHVNAPWFGKATIANAEPGPKPDQFTIEEWREVCRKIVPEWTDEQFYEAVEGYFAMKDRKEGN